MLLEPDDAESSQLVADLVRSALAVVPSSLAVIVVVDGRSGPLATVSDRYGQVDISARSSLRLELSSRITGTEDFRPNRLIFLAEADGAFAEFSDLLATAPGALDHPTDDSRHRLTGVVIDGDLEADDPDRRDDQEARDDRGGPAAPTGDEDRAIGFLIDRGHEPAEAFALLDNRARLWNLTRPEAANRILHSLD